MLDLLSATSMVAQDDSQTQRVNVDDMLMMRKHVGYVSDLERAAFVAEMYEANNKLWFDVRLAALGAFLGDKLAEFRGKVYAV
jgi:hypothetical protein